MDRNQYFENIKLKVSPLLQLTEHLDPVITAFADGRTDVLISFANKLKHLNTPASISRADFIILQCVGRDASHLFEQHHESWGIPKFEETLITVNDFKNGFLWTFRDHTTSWSEDEEAREWFYTHIEARFIRQYELWACDQGFDEILLTVADDYNNILLSIIHDHEDYSPFRSPVFSNNELHTFYDAFNEVEKGFDKVALLEIMEQNVNW